jgi:hypothetical protein
VFLGLGDNFSFFIRGPLGTSSLDAEVVEGAGAGVEVVLGSGAVVGIMMGL